MKQRACPLKVSEKSWQTSSKIDNKREKTQIANIRNEKVSITTDHADIKRVMRGQE